MDLLKMSRIIIFIPLVIVVISILWKPDKKTQTSLSLTPTISNAPDQTKEIKAGSSQKSIAKLDLKGPYKCAYKDNDLQVNAYIKNKQVYAEMLGKDKNYVLLSQDCVYTWKGTEKTGKKICGIGQYLGLFEMFSSTPLLDLNSIIPMLFQMQNVGTNSGELQKKLPDISRSCIKEEVDEAVFQIPSSIKFIQGTLTVTPKL